jgi:hypothetical protein
MIKSIFLPTPPSMGRFSTDELLSLFDPLKEITNEEVIDDHGEKLVKKTFRDKSNYLTLVLYSFPSIGLTARLYNCYSLISEVEPDLVKVCGLSESSFLLAYNYFYDLDSRTKINDCLDELVRVANLALWRANGNRDEAYDDVEFYIKTYVKWERK